MAELEKSPRLTCGSMALAGLLAVVAVIALQRQTQPPTWASTGAAAIAVVAAFLITRGVQNFFWALLAATLLMLHPTWNREADNNPDELLAGAVVLAGLAGVRIGWHLAWYPRFVWRAWVPLLLFLPICAGLAWKADKQLGLLAVVLFANGMIVGTLLGARLQEREAEIIPSRLNVLTAAFSVVLVPAAGLIVYRFLDRSLYTESGSWRFVRDAFPESMAVGFNVNSLAGWSWPTPWLVLPLLVCSLGLAIHRGCKQWAVGQGPTAWFLPSFAAVMVVRLLLYSEDPGEAVPVLMTALVVLCFVFFVAEMLQRGFRRMVLLPPDERLEVHEMAK